MPFERATLERCLQVSCEALAPSVMLASVQLLARTQGKSPQETPDFLSHDTDRWALHLLLRGRPERRADASLAARAALFIADVRVSLRPAVRSLSPCRARFPRLRTQRLAGQKKIRVYPRSHRRDHQSLHRGARALPVHALHARFRRPRGLRENSTSTLTGVIVN